MLAGLSHDEVVHEVVVSPRDAFIPLPDTQIIKRPDLRQLITPSLRQGGLNDISFADFDDAHADAKIDDAIAHYTRIGLRFRWTVGPDSRPADLSDRLARRGLRPVHVLGMARETANALGDHPDISIQEADESTVNVFTNIMAAGWSMDPEPLDAYHRLVLTDPQRAHRLFIAYYKGEPAGVAGLTFFARSVYLIGAVVLPPFRGVGLYRALVTERLRLAAARGIPIATSQAIIDTSAPILQRLGFQTVCPLVSFVNDV